MKINIPIALSSLILSLMLWFVVFSQNAPQPDVITAQLSLDGLDDNRFFLRKAPTEVRLTVSGPVDRIKAMRDERVTASVDLSQPKPGINTYPISLSPAWAGKYLMGARPTVRINLEPMANRMVKVNSVVKGALRDNNLQLTNRRTTPTEVTVRGPVSEVETVREARAYLDLSLIDPQNPVPQDADVVPLDRNESRPQHVRATPSVVVHFFSIGGAPITKIAQVVPDMSVTYDPSVLPDGYRIEPKVVSLTGKPGDLTNVSKVPTEPIRIENLARNRTVRVRLIAPPRTALVGTTSVDVTIRVRPAPRPRQKPKPKPEIEIKPPVTEPPVTEPPTNR